MALPVKANQRPVTLTIAGRQNAEVGFIGLLVQRPPIEPERRNTSL
jgi:hypothetical protein